jgi:hypothetical protein
MVFFFSISRCCSSGEECFFGVIFCQNAIFFLYWDPYKGFFEFLFAKKEGFLNWRSLDLKCMLIEATK